MTTTRKEFVEIYDKENFYDSIPFGRGYNGDVPTIGTLNITEVKESDYFFC